MDESAQRGQLEVRASFRHCTNVWRISMFTIEFYDSHFLLYHSHCPFAPNLFDQGLPMSLCISRYDFDGTLRLQLHIDGEGAAYEAGLLTHSPHTT